MQIANAVAPQPETEKSIRRLDQTKHTDSFEHTELPDDELEHSEEWPFDRGVVTSDEENKKTERDIVGQTVTNEWGDCG